MEGSKMLGSGVIGGNIYQGCFCGGQRYLVAFVILAKPLPFSVWQVGFRQVTSLPTVTQLGCDRVSTHSHSRLLIPEQHTSL